VFESFFIIVLQPLFNAT